MEKTITVEKLYELMSAHDPEAFGNAQNRELVRRFYDVFVEPLFEDDREKCTYAENLYTDVLIAREKQGFIAGYKAAVSMILGI